MTLRVVGLDVSLTSTGMSDGTAHRVTQPAVDDPLEQRMIRIVDASLSFVLGHGPVVTADLVVIEAGAFSRAGQSQGAEVLSALRYMVRCNLFGHGVPFAMVTPTGLKAYTTGRGQATKPQMVQAMKDRHGIDFTGVKVKDGRYDLADGAALAAMGYAHLGQPLPTGGPPAPLASLLAVKWPPVTR